MDGMEKFENPSNVGQNIALRLKRKGASQVDLANHLGVSRQAVANYVSGRVKPSINNMFDIAAFFGCTITDLCMPVIPARIAGEEDDE